jgi:outer membrane protein assembly factor BamE (lipoprotein component of BamABCDE complex)
LVDERFRQVNAGMTRDDIYQLLGKPTERTPFPLKNEEVWSWRHKADGQTVVLFNIHLDMDGRVKTTSQSMDLHNQGG